jgi:hypothetical protein
VAAQPDRLGAATVRPVDRIVAYDLGLASFQRRLLEATLDVEVREVPLFVPHWRQGWTRKTWIWTHL